MGGPVSCGGLLGVRISPTTVRKLPAVNRTSGTANSIDPNALLDGIGTISSFLCPIAPTIPNGHHVGIGNTIGATCPISIPNLLAIKILQKLAMDRVINIGRVKKNSEFTISPFPDELLSYPYSETQCDPAMVRKTDMTAHISKLW